MFYRWITTRSPLAINGGFAFALSQAMHSKRKSVTAIRRLMVRIQKTRGVKRRATHPGAMLREDFLADFDLTVPALAAAVGVSRHSINELLRERRALSDDMSLRLAKLFGNSPELWLNAQRAVALSHAAQAIGREMALITPLRVA